ncbi:MAG TPA: CRTAC1 family protein [Candidatus Limnocylindrales bacterium]|nr:CRTAC1 family protein [Candidatus Limnocylindrales bacterium]
MPTVAALVVAGAALALAVVVARPAEPAAPTVALPPPRFIDEAGTAGVDHGYDGDFDFYVGGGVAAFDCDDDQKPDLFFAGGSEPAALFRNRSATGGALAFERIAGPTTDLTSVTGAYPLDIDGDRHTDLAVLRLGENVLLRGLGDCRFERANELLDVEGGNGWTTAFSATWEGAASLPTLAFGDYLTLDDAGEWTGDCANDTLLRPNAEPGATGYGAPIPLRPSWCTLSMLFSDWDRSGRRDLRMSNDRHYHQDRGEEQLWRIESGQLPRLYTRNEGWRPLSIWGMGIASQDLTGDGYPEVYLTSQADNKLQTLADGPAEPDYTDIALRRGATAHRPFAGDETLPSTAWHPAFEDVNNDGFIDLYVSKGNVERQLDYAMKDPSDLLIGQPDGTFVEGAMAAGIVDFAKARGAALVDLNADGLLDLVQVVRRDNVRLWRNVGSGDAASPKPMGRWIDVSLDQDAPNHAAIGAWVDVKMGAAQTTREVTVGGGHVSGQLGPIHFGLGTADRAEVRVTWPDGEVGPWMTVEADRVVRIQRGEATPTTLQP